jgi:hypothetical protein
MEKTKNKKRGRPKKPRPKKIIWELPEGVRLVALSTKHPLFKTHRWIGLVENTLIGYYKTWKAAQAAIEAHGIS